MGGEVEQGVKEADGAAGVANLNGSMSAGRRKGCASR